MKEVILKNATCQMGKRDESEEMKRERYAKEEKEKFKLLVENS